MTHSTTHDGAMPTATRRPAPNDATLSGVAADVDTSLGTFGPYELKQFIAQGGMGLVFRAVDTRLNREVALKRLNQGVRRDDAKRFIQEAHVISELDHPNIIKVFEFDEINGHPYFTMRLAEGGSVGDQIERYRDDPHAAAELVEKVARGVHFAHQRGILHRDLKPSNILLDKHGEPLVSDFGLAKLLDDDAGITASGALLGTPAYMSPEQASGSLDRVDRATDVWALGVILYELLTGSRPYPGKTRAEVLPKILSDEIPAPKSIRRSIPQPLADIVMKCLARDPRDRYPTAEAVADHLKKWRAGEPFRIWRRPRTILGRMVHHRLRPREFIVGVAVVIVAAALAWALPNMIGREARAEQRAIAELNDEIYRFQRVTLIGETGGPKYSRLITAGEQIIPNANAEYTLRAGDKPVLVELHPGPQESYYKIEAEVCHKSGDAGHVGIYVGRVGPVADWHWMFAGVFADQGRSAYLPDADKRPDSSTAGLAVTALNLGRGGGDGPIFTAATRRFEPVGKSPPYRKLVLEVSPGRVEFIWENKPLGDAAGHEIFAAATRGPGVKPPIPAFAPNQGLGLYVESGEASFRNVRLVTTNPLKPPIPERP